MAPYCDVVEGRLRHGAVAGRLKLSLPWPHLSQHFTHSHGLPRPWWPEAANVADSKGQSKTFPPSLPPGPSAEMHLWCWQLIDSINQTFFILNYFWFYLLVLWILEKAVCTCVCVCILTSLLGRKNSQKLELSHITWHISSLLTCM